MKASCENIDEHKGRGIVAKRMAPRAAVIFAGFAALIDEADEFGSWEEYDFCVAHQLKGAKSQWVREFFNIPAPEVEIRGKFAARFDYGNALLEFEGRNIRAVSGQLSKLNHACVPNAHLQLHPEKRHCACTVVMCRANRDIEEGEEITIAYEYFDEEVQTRKQRIFQQFGFHCACNHCINPQISVENDFAFVQMYLPQFQDDEVMVQKPTKALKLAYGIIRAYLNARVHDMRLARVLDRCVRICAYHSDAGRVLYFAILAWSVYTMKQGKHRLDAERMGTAMHEPDKMAGWATSTRGFSFLNEGEFLHKLEGRNDRRALDAAFMLNIPDHTYLLLSKVHEEYDSDSDSEELEVDEFMARLELEKKEHDEERRQQDDKKDPKGKGKEPQRTGRNDREDRGEDVKETGEEEQEASDRGDVAEMGRLKDMGSKSTPRKKNDKGNKGKKRGNGRRRR